MQKTRPHVFQIREARRPNTLIAGDFRRLTHSHKYRRGCITTGSTHKDSGG
jgi:hypothetical protein